MTEINASDARDQKIRFIIEIDKLKGIIRKTLLTDQSRLENAAEHSWHAALAALVLFDEVPIEGMNMDRVVKMLLIHDVVEIDSGDVLCYNTEQRRVQDELEQKAARRIFSLLPDNQAAALRQIWLEFQAGQTPEACFANAIDRLLPLLQAIHTKGKTWRQHKIRKEQVIERMQPIRFALPSLWDYVQKLIDDAADRGYLKQ